MMCDDPAQRRNELCDFAHSLKYADVTALLTSEASESNAYASRYGNVEYLSEGVVILRYLRTAEYQATQLGIEIQKLRNTNPAIASPTRSPKTGSGSLSGRTSSDY